MARWVARSGWRIASGGFVDSCYIGSHNRTNCWQGKATKERKRIHVIAQLHKEEEWRRFLRVASALTVGFVFRRFSSWREEPEEELWELSPELEELEEEEEDLEEPEEELRWRVGFAVVALAGLGPPLLRLATAVTAAAGAVAVPGPEEEAAAEGPLNSLARWRLAPPDGALVRLGRLRGSARPRAEWRGGGPGLRDVSGWRSGGLERQGLGFCWSCAGLLAVNDAHLCPRRGLKLSERREEASEEEEEEEEAALRRGPALLVGFRRRPLTEDPELE